MFYVFVYRCVCVGVCLRRYVCGIVYVCLRMRVCVCVCVCVYVYVHTHTHTPTHTPTHLHTAPPLEAVSPCIIHVSYLVLPSASVTITRHSVCVGVCVHACHSGRL